MKIRTKILLILLILFVLLLLLFLLFRKKPTAAPASEQPVIETTAPASPLAPTPAQVERDQTVALQTVAKTFVERYGSFSSESNYANIEDVLPLATKEFQDMLREQMNASVSKESYGITTRVLVMKTDARNETAGTAKMTVTTQREERKGALAVETVRYQTIALTFAKEQNVWKVASATWQ